MAYIRAHETTQRRRGKPVRRYEVCWREPATDVNGLPIPARMRARPYEPASRRLFGVPVVVSNAQAAGVSHAVGSGAIGLDTDTAGVQVAWSETSNATDFATNMIRCRCEGRFATSVFSPAAVVKGDLTA
jgi:hypothetical protein